MLSVIRGNWEDASESESHELAMLRVKAVKLAEVRLAGNEKSLRRSFRRLCVTSTTAMAYR